MSKALRFIGELKRRRVYGSAVAYIVVGLGVLGAAELILDPLGLGDVQPIIVIVTLLGFPLAMVLAWIYDLTPAGLVRDGETNLERGESEAPKPASQNEGVSDGIVVLPFENLSPHKEDEYFSDGVTEDLITQLYRIGSLRVISRTSAWQYKGSRVGAKQIAGDLGVAYLLEGSVRRSGSRVRIVAQLIDARHDRHMWAETYDRELEDIFGIQSEVANRIASALHLTLSDVGGGTPVDPESAVRPNAPDEGAPLPQGPGTVMTSDVDAYDLYLRGRYLWNRRSETELNESVSHLASAIERDPGFVRARSALAEAYVTEAIYGLRSAREVLPLAQRQADDALDLHPEEAPAISALACIRAIYEWEWAPAEAGFVRAIEASPQYPIAPQWLAMNVLVPQGRFDDAVSQLERARELDPLSLAVQACFGVVDFLRRDYPRARETFDLLVQKDPGFQFAHFFGGMSLLYSGDAARAAESLQRAMEVGGWSPEVAAAMGCAFVAEGREARGRETVDRMRSESAERYVSPVRLSLLQSALSDHEAALDSLDEAVTGRATDLIWLDVHPGFDALRDHPRFVDVRRRIFADEPER
jgi:TolB-like protein